MPRNLLLALFFCFLLYIPCRAIDHKTEDILNLIKLDHSKTTREGITSLLGTPAQIEESRKRTKWHYKLGKSTLEISWRHDEPLAEKVYFTNEAKEKIVCNLDLQQNLKNGTTDIPQTLKLLGIPANMTIKKVTQIMRYVYEDSMLRLFFRNNKLVDFALVEHKAL